MMPSNSSWTALGKDLLDRIDRDAHHLPLARRDAGDRLQEAAGGRRKADGDLVDDLSAEHVVKSLMEPSTARVTIGSGSWGAERCPTIRSPSPGCVSTRSAKSWASWPGPDDDHESRIATMGAVPGERRTEKEAADKRHGRLDHEQHREEEAADVRLLEEEEGRQGDRHDQQRRSRQVADLGQTRSSARRGGRGRRSRAPRPRRPAKITAREDRLDVQGPPQRRDVAVVAEAQLLRRAMKTPTAIRRSRRP